MYPLRNSTLLFLVRRKRNKINEICLAIKKRGFGVGRWNGVGGKVENEEIEKAAKREAKEEINVCAGDCRKMAELEFRFPHNPPWDQLVHVYFSFKWKGDPTESEEMRPQWFLPENIPFNFMWPDDIFWLPSVLKGNLVRGFFEFGKNDIIQKKKIKYVNSLKPAVEFCTLSKKHSGKDRDDKKTKDLWRF